MIFPDDIQAFFYKQRFFNSASVLLNKYKHHHAEKLFIIALCPIIFGCIILTWMKNVHILKQQKFILRVMLSICLIFYHFQPSAAYKSVSYKKAYIFVPYRTKVPCFCKHDKCGFSWCYFFLHFRYILLHFWIAKGWFYVVFAIGKQNNMSMVKICFLLSNRLYFGAPNYNVPTIGAPL